MVFLDPILNPLLNLSPLWAIILVSFFVALTMTMVYKWMTDQELMKVLKADMKNFQKEMKELRDHPEKVIAVQKRAMQTNMKYMMQSFKPTFVTMIPILLIFGWLNAHLAFMPILPDTAFNTIVEFDEDMAGNIDIVAPEEITLLSGKSVDIENGKAFWTLKGPLGRHVLEYKYNNKSHFRSVLISETQEYEPPVKTIKENGINTITIDNEPFKPLNLFGWQIGWFWTYVIFSVIFSMSLRKILKIH